MREYLSLYIIVLLCFGAVLVANTSRPTLSNISFGGFDIEYKPGTVSFFGDLMLARDVDKLMQENGNQYPFSNVLTLLRSTDYAIANFEAAVPDEHVPTASSSLTFSVREEQLQAAAWAGLDILSLANNHAFDFEEPGYEHTLEQCIRHALLCAGHPTALPSSTASSTLVFETGDTTVGILFLHTLFDTPATSTLQAIVSELELNTELQVAYIHWGEEYQSSSSLEQQQLARELIEYGIDLVVGHHPHVVQELEVFNDRLIVYSLGNFIFDQYFDEAVQQGLSLRLTILNDALVYHVIPLTSMETPAQPRIMSGEESDRFLEQLHKKSNLVPAKYWKNNTISLPR